MIRRQLLPAAVAIALLAVPVGAAAFTTPPHAARPTTSAPTASASANHRRADALVLRLIADVPRLPHETAGRHSSAFHPHGALTLHSVSATASAHAPGTVAHAIRYLRHHHGSALRVDGTVRVDATSQHSTITFRVPTTRYAYDPTVSVRATEDARGGVTLHLRADTIWLPHKPAADSVHDASSVSVAVYRDGRKTVRGTFGKHFARALEKRIDRLGLFPPARFYCPAEVIFTYDVLRFTMPDGEVRAQVSPTGCASTTLSVHGHYEPTLMGIGGTDAAVLRALHLPRHYGY